MDVVLVGDSGAMTVLGYPSTVPVTTDEMLMLAAAVRRGLRTPMMVGDLPFGSYEVSDEQAVATAQRFVKEAGCDAVKLERGGSSVQRAQGHHRRRHPGDGPRGPDPADGHRPGRLPLAGPHRRAGARGGRGRAGAPGGGVLLDRVRGHPQRPDRRADAAAGDPGDRHRRRSRDRRPGAGLPRPAGHLRRARGPVRQALRRRAQGHDRRRQRLRGTTCASGATRRPSTATRWRPTSASGCASSWPSACSHSTFGGGGGLPFAEPRPQPTRRSPQ